jgi:hypothetical protein
LPRRETFIAYSLPQLREHQVNARLIGDLAKVLRLLPKSPPGVRLSCSAR